MSNPIAGWYPDPSGDPAKLRYWDGHGWTEYFASAHPPAAAAAQAGGHGTAQEVRESQPGVTAQQSDREPSTHATSTEQPTADELTAEQPTAQVGQEPWSQEQPGTEPATEQLPTDRGTEQLPAQEPSGHPAQAPDRQATQQLPHQPTEQFGAPAGGYTAAGYGQGQQGYVQPGHGAPQSYGGQQQYGTQPQYGTQYGAQQQYGAQTPYAAQPYAGQQPYGGQQPYNPVQQQGQSSGSPYGGGPQGTGGGGSGKGLVIGIIVVSLILLGAVIWAIVLLLSGGDQDPVPAPQTGESTPETSTPTSEPEPTPESGDEETAPPEQTGGHLEGGALTLGETLTVDLAGYDTWTGTLTVSETTVVLIDVVAEADLFSDDDLLIELSGEDVTAENDDRGQFLSFGDANMLDPVLGAELPAGEYEITVRPYAGTAEGAFTITVREPEPVEPGETFSIDLADNEYWLAALDLEDDTSVVIDTVSTEGDPLLSILSEGDNVESMDDTSEGEGGTIDPYLEIDLAAGIHFIALSDYWGDPMTAELSLTTAD